MSLDESLRALSRAQNCVFTTEQAHAVGATESRLRHAVDSGQLVRLAPRIFSLGGVPLTPEVLLTAAYLEAGGQSALSLESAAAHWSFSGFMALPAQVTRLRDGTFPPVSLAKVHTTRVLPDSHVVDLGPIRVTTPTRTLFDLAPRVGEARIERLLDRAWARGLTSGPLLVRTLDELRGKGRAGIRVMRALIDARGADYRPPESGQESRFAQLLNDDGQPPMERQVDVGDDVWIGRVDFIDRDARVVVEIDSELYHTSISDRRADDHRRAELEAAGWTVIRISQHELWHDPRAVQRRVRAARKLAGRTRTLVRV
jgi:very-short-patch-repair endonuclease